MLTVNCQDRTEGLTGPVPCVAGPAADLLTTGKLQNLFRPALVLVSNHMLAAVPRSGQQVFTYQGLI